MTRIRTFVMAGGATIAIAVGALLASGAMTSAQTSTPAATTAPTATAAPTTHTSNEDPAHEATESAEREAAEDNGTATFGHDGAGHGDGTFTPNEDPAHEANESAEREAQEDAGQFPTVP